MNYVAAHPSFWHRHIEDRRSQQIVREINCCVSKELRRNPVQYLKKIKPFKVEIIKITKISAPNESAELLNSDVS